MTPRIILAKYVPDLSRMEPRNIGVFVWSRGEVRAKFLEAESAPFVNEPKTYTRLVEYWTRFITAESFRPVRGKPVPRHDPACMDSLLTTQEGNYILVDAGEMLDTISVKELPKATESLFHELVAIPVPPERDAGETLKRKCDSIFETSGLAEREDYRTKFPIMCGLFGSKRLMHASYGFGNGKPLSLINRVNLSNEASVNNAGLILHEAAEEGLLPIKHCAALVQSSAINTRAAKNGYDWLNGFCTVIDVDQPNAETRLKDIVPVQLQASH